MVLFGTYTFILLFNKYISLNSCLIIDKSICKYNVYFSDYLLKIYIRLKQISFIYYILNNNIFINKYKL